MLFRETGNVRFSLLPLQGAMREHVAEVWGETL